MYVNYSGWTKDHGSFSCNIYIDENKQDYEVVYGDGSVAKQTGPFHEVTADWNHDGDVYSMFGAWFQSESGRGSFFTPEDLVRIAADGLEKDRFYGNEAKCVKGITIPLPERRPRLDDVIRQNEVRAANQEAERNRKMNALGIRPPGEPWAR